MLERDRKVVLEAARAIRPYLRELVEDPDAVDSELAAALAAADADRADAVLRGRRATRRWTEEHARLGVPADLVAPAVRSAAGPPGGGDIVRAPRFRCPAEADDYVWYRRAAGMPIPVCPTHRQRLVPDLRPRP